MSHLEEVTGRIAGSGCRHHKRGAVLAQPPHCRVGPCSRPWGP